MGFKHRLLATCVVAATAFGGVANAQDDARDALLDEIIVTAERREQSLNDVPVAVSAFTDEKRDKIGINSVSDMANFTPGLSHNVASDRVTVRGIGRFTNSRTSEGGVAMYVDGFYSSTATALSRSSLFTDRLEVLRGPQGTLYGRNSVGGAINIISKRPTEDFYAEVRTTIANYDRTEYEAVLSGPITDTLRYRLGFHKQDQDAGWYNNVSTVGNGTDEGLVVHQTYAELQLDGSLADEKLEWWLKMSTEEWHNRGSGVTGRTSTTFGVYDTQAAFTGGLTPNPAWGYTTQQAANSDPRAFSSDRPNIVDNELISFTAQVTLHLDNFDVKYVGGHYYYEYDTDVDTDGVARIDPLVLTRAQTTAIPAGQTVFYDPRHQSETLQETWWFSNELNLSSTYDGRVQILAGLYQYREGSNDFLTNVRNVSQPQFRTPILPSGAPAAANPLGYYTVAGSYVRSETYAAYAQTDISLTDELKFTGGLRYTYDRKMAEERARAICFLAPACAAFGVQAVDISATVYNPDAAALGTAPDRPALDPSVVIPAYTDPESGMRRRRLQNDWQAWTYTLGFDWQPNSANMYYAKYTRGYKAGGFNANSLAQFTTTAAEFINSYEVGAKNTIGGQLQLNTSLFYLDYKNIQAPLTGIHPVTLLNETRFFNLPKVGILGFEAEATWSPIQNLQFLANYAYLDAKIKDACCFQDPQDPLAQQPGANPSGPPVRNAAGVITGQSQDLAGDVLPYATPHRVTLNANYTWDLPIGSLTVSGSYIWRADTYYGIFNRPYNMGKAGEQVDARALFKDAEDRFTIIAFVKNLFDENIVAGSSGSINSGNRALNRTLVWEPPRRYGVELQYRF